MKQNQSSIVPDFRSVNLIAENMLVRSWERPAMGHGRPSWPTSIAAIALDSVVDLQCCEYFWQASEIK